MRRSVLTVSVLFLILFSGCATRTVPDTPVVIDKSLPQVHINGHLSDPDAIAFEWKPIADPRVAGVRIYRDTPSDGTGKLYRIAQIEGTLKTHYVDSGLQPSTRYHYRFTTYNTDGKESMPDKTLTAATLKPAEPVSFFTATPSLARSAKLIWRPHTDLRVTGYAIERRDANDAEFNTVDTLRGRLNAEYIDRGLDDGKLYRYRIVAVMYNGEKTAPSAEVTVSTKPLPKPPLNLKATRGGVGEITLTWDDGADIEHYKIYRADDEDGYYAYHAKTTATRLTDKLVENGATYYYSVSAVDLDGLESPKGHAAYGTTLPAPKPPVLLGVSLKDGAAVIRWKSGDPATTGYSLIKTTRTGWLDSSSAAFDDLKTTQFTDVNVVPGREYLYEVIAIDKHGLRSAPSEQASIVPEAP